MQTPESNTLRRFFLPRMGGACGSGIEFFDRSGNEPRRNKKSVGELIFADGPTKVIPVTKFGRGGYLIVIG